MTVDYIGKALSRVEDRALVTGNARYVADILVPNRLEAVFVRSHEGHGILRAVDVSQAHGVPGVVGVYASTDLPDLLPTGVRDWRRPVLATERVRFVGEPVAVILAEDLARAEDAAELVLVDIDPLPCVLDPTESAQDSVRLFDGLTNVTSVQTYGEAVDDVFATAPVVIEHAINNGRVAPASMEARAILVVPAPDGRLTVWCSHQAPHGLRDDLAGAFHLDGSAVHVIAPSVGGAFGAKSQTYPEYLVVGHLARRLQRPVRWIEGRSESFAAAPHGRGQKQRIRLAADQEGRVLAFEVDIDADVGAYPGSGEFIPTLTAWMLSGPYRIPRLCVRVRTVVTNSPPTSAYRGAGRPEAAFALERTMDELARRLRLDPAEVRYRNFIPPELFPYRSPTGAEYDSGHYAEALDLALDLARYRELREEQRRQRAVGSDRLLGIGIASYLERTGGQTGATEYGSVEVRGDGSIVARSGSSSQGQGHETAFAQVVASALDVEVSRVRVVQGDTAEVPDGVGTFASRSMQIGGSALHVAAQRVLDEARTRASKLLEVAGEDLRYAESTFSITGSPDRTLTLEDIAEETGSLLADETFASPQAFPFGSYVAVAEIDRLTGAIRLERLVAVDDCGVQINPMLVGGQVVGSITQGMGQALYEEIAFNERGQPLAGSFLTYGLPSTSEMAEIVVGETVTPNPNVPIGAKGAGETGCIGAPPAIVNAVLDALDGYDLSGLDMPLTPEKVWRVLQARGTMAG